MKFSIFPCTSIQLILVSSWKTSPRRWLSSKLACLSTPKREKFVIQSSKLLFPMLKTFAINSKSVPKNSSVMASTLQSTPIRSTNFSLFSTKSKISSVSKWSSQKSLLRSKSRAWILLCLSVLTNSKSAAIWILALFLPVFHSPPPTSRRKKVFSTALICTTMASLFLIVSRSKTPTWLSSRNLVLVNLSPSSSKPCVLWCSAPKFSLSTQKTSIKNLPTLLVALMFVSVLAPTSVLILLIYQKSLIQKKLMTPCAPISPLFTVFSVSCSAAPLQL